MSRRTFLLSLSAIAVLIALLWKQFSHGIPLETNLLRLLPATEPNPVAEQAVEHLTRTIGDRVLFLVGSKQRTQAIQAARNFGAELQQSSAFKSVRVNIPSFNGTQLHVPFLPARFNLLSSVDRSDLERDAAGALQQRLQQRLAGMLTGGVGLALEADPFDYFGRYLSALPWQDSHLLQQDGVLLVEQGGRTWVLVLTELNGSAFSEPVQNQVIAAVTQAEQASLRQVPDLQLLRMGSLFYAHAARTSAQHDVEWIGTFSTVGILLLLWAAFRSLVPLALVVLSVAVGLGAALLVTVQWFGSLHLLTLVFGASLIGEAVDYAIQVCSVHAGTQTSVKGVVQKLGWNSARELAPLWPSLILALATSVLGYFVLFLTPFPALNQVALFASSGLIVAFLVVRCWLPVGLNGVTPGRAHQTIGWCQRGLQKLQQHMIPKYAWLAYGFCLLVAIPGWWLGHADDDIRLLTTRPSGLLEQEKQFRSLLEKENNADSGARFFLVEGASEQEVLQREEQLRMLLEPLQQQNQIGSVQALSAFVPSLQRQQQDHYLLERAGFGDQKKIAGLLSSAGFNADVAIRLSQAFQQHTATLELSQWLASPIATPYRHLWLGKTGQGVASIVIPRELTSTDALRALQLPGVSWVDKAASASRLFAFYRHAGVMGLALMLVVLLCVLAWRYSWNGSVRVLLPTMVALISAPAVLGYLNFPLTLFSILALFLVLGVGVNYSIFLLDGARLARQQTESNAYGGGNFLGIILSSTTTLLSFGLLGFSSMPVLRQFGLVLAVGITLAVLLAPTTLAWERSESTS